MCLKGWDYLIFHFDRLVGYNFHLLVCDVLVEDFNGYCVRCSFYITSSGQGIFIYINESDFGGIFKWFRIYMMDDLLYDVRMGEKGLLGWRCCVFWFVLVKGFGFELERR